MSVITAPGRRAMLRAAAWGGVGLASATVGVPAFAAEKETGAVEDLMREHGVLRRVLLVYKEAGPKLRNRPQSVPADQLVGAAKLFRSFGEDYHERKLEEAYIFPEVKKAGGALAVLVDALKAQHDRGREITDYILAVAGRGRLGADGAALAQAFDSFVLMYQNHTAREDTVLFQAWKAALSGHRLHEMGEKFEDIEKATFGGDGFDEAVTQIAAIETALGLADIAQFTAPEPPRA